jgi:two-component system, LuxR family, response regulator FixJ
MLSKREKQIMELVISGHTVEEIGKLLFIAESTVVTHKQHIQAKLQAKNSCHAVFLYAKQKINQEKIIKY